MKTLKVAPGETRRSGLAAAMTRRELEVLRLVAEDCSCAQAAVRLGVSPHTVVSHLKNAYRKLEVHSAAAAVMRVIQLGLFPVDAPHKLEPGSATAGALANLSDR
jgi:DNA-binding CsgD family transcriptional regulator